MDTSVAMNIATRLGLREALEKARPEMAVIEQSDLAAITVDPLAAASIARGALPQIMALRANLEALSVFDIRNLDNLDLYISASMQTQAIFQAANMPPQHFQELVAEATALREQLLNDATALAKRGFISEAKLSALKGTNGFRNIASDVLTLAAMIRGNWTAVSGKTCVSEAELNRAEFVGDQLINDIGVRDQSPAAIAAVALERQQAFTLFVRAYDQVRRAVDFLRWDEGDAEEIAPSLYGGRRRKSGTEVDQKSDPVPITAPVTVDMPATVAAAAAAAKPGVGLPGADPFVH